MTLAELDQPDAYPAPCERQFMFDGWYLVRSWADDVLAYVAELEGVTPIGIVTSQGGAWGVLYTSDRVWFPNHLITDWAT